HDTIVLHRAQQAAIVIKKESLRDFSPLNKAIALLKGACVEDANRAIVRRRGQPGAVLRNVDAGDAAAMPWQFAKEPAARGLKAHQVAVAARDEKFPLVQERAMQDAAREGLPPK